ncbi:phage baseplate assembly protein [Roseomonas indoligenes]|uniref:Phage baseplate assembly protein n=1 Tax=Roseomonas indoligenes TaxID=2820811 RepID=A0A940N0N9_9PROT|nr:phage baseplate assembly protein [Pararoseomonas indoligenes]MBP0492157.1 phage baseplate assembly protein [Pararoseomonas indoligenes]
MADLLDRAWGRLTSALGFGTITATKGTDGQGVRQAQVRFSAVEVRDGTPLICLYGVASRPLPGADAVLVFVEGNRSKGIIIATNDRRYQIDLAEGEVAIHSDEGDSVHLKRGRVVKITAGTKLEIDAPLVTLTGRMEAAGDVKAGTISLQNHVHGGVQRAAAQTDAPTP